MVHSLRWSLLLFVTISALVQHTNPVAAQPRNELVAPTEALSPAEQQKMFHLPPGFEIQLVAAEPDLRKPMNMSFDARGRLYFTESREYPFPAQEGTPRDTIRLITDTNGDGVPDRVSVFADGLNIPIGITPVADAVLGYGIPNVYRFRDTDGDDRADQREIAYSRFGFDDTHGMASSFTWWLDGWVYACHGFRNASTVKGADGQPVSMQSGNTYRLKPDGSHIEQFTHGQVNPFGLAFDSLGNLYSADCHSKPLYMLLRGAYYPSFGKPDDGLGFGPEMISHSHGSTGICGVVFYGADNFPPAYHDTVFICNPVTGRINHDRLEPHGSTYKAIELPDFITCDDGWFRPVDIKLAMDGSLYIADFYNCIIGHYEVPLTHPRRDRERGRIWRVVYTGDKGKPHTPPRDLTRSSTEELLATLGDRNIVVRTQATHQLVHRIGGAAVEPARKLIAGDSSPLQRAHALWVLERLQALDMTTIVRVAMNTEAIVRVHLMKALAGRADWNPGAKSDVNLDELVTARLTDENAFVRRAAADALGQHPHADHIKPLLGLWEQTHIVRVPRADGNSDPVLTLQGDTHLIHVVRMALRDTLQSLGNVAELAAKFREQPEQYRRLADVTLGIRNPAGAKFILAYVQNAAPEPARLPAFVYHAARYSAAESLPQAVSLAVSRRPTSDSAQQAALLSALRRATQERSTALPPEVRAWSVELAMQLLNNPNDGSLRTGVDLSREFGLTETAATLETLSQAGSRRPPLRQAALEALAALDAGRAVPLLSRLIENPGTALAERQKGAEILGGLNTPASRGELLNTLRVVPDQLGVALARALAGSREGGEALLAAVGEGKASARLLQDAVVDGRLKSLNLPELSGRLDKLLKDVPPEDERVRQLLASRLASYAKAQPDTARGVEVFAKICANCHRLQDKGTKVGPDLDGIGVRGLERLLEDTLTPNRNVDQAFRSTTLALKDGKVVTGLVLREEGAVLVVISEQGKEVRVPATEVEERRLLKLSPMPANIAEQLPEADFQNLMAYLLSQRDQPVRKP